MSAQPAAFQATYSDWRLIKGRKVVQIVFEVPLEGSGLAYDVLGGMPDPGESVWCGIARIETKSEARPKKSWDEMNPAQQAGILCADLSFRQYLREQEFLPVKNEADAAEAVRRICRVNSRKDIDPNDTRWKLLVRSYREWQQPSKVAI